MLPGIAFKECLNCVFALSYVLEKPERDANGDEGPLPPPPPLFPPPPPPPLLLFRPSGAA